MTDERDRYRVKTPPAGVRAQTAPPELDWDNELTPLPQSTRAAISKVDGRVKSATSELAGQVTAVRAELRSDLRVMDAKVDALAGHLSELSADTAKMGGQLEILVADRAIELTETSTTRTATVTTELKIHEARELSAIEEAKKLRDHWRLVALKVIGGVSAVWALISAMLLSKGC